MLCYQIFCSYRRFIYFASCGKLCWKKPPIGIVRSVGGIVVIWGVCGVSSVNFKYNSILSVCSHVQDWFIYATPLKNFYKPVAFFDTTCSRFFSKFQADNKYYFQRLLFLPTSVQSNVYIVFFMVFSGFVSKAFVNFD